MHKICQWLGLALMALGLMMVGGAEYHQDWDLFWSQFLIGIGVAVAGGALAYPYTKEHTED